MYDPELRQIAEGILAEIKPHPLEEVGYKGQVAILHIGQERLMQEAVILRRKRIALNRSEAIEGAYDYLLHLATKGEYERTGEVWLDKENERASAFCSSPDVLLVT